MPICSDSQIASSHIAPIEAIWLEAIIPETNLRILIFGDLGMEDWGILVFKYFEIQGLRNFEIGGNRGFLFLRIWGFPHCLFDRFYRPSDGHNCCLKTWSQYLQHFTNRITKKHEKVTITCIKLFNIVQVVDSFSSIFYWVRNRVPSSFIIPNWCLTI